MPTATMTGASPFAPVSVRVNVINEMKKLRESTYSDRYTWVDEVVQNCQRAGATHIDVSFEDNCIVISDNGKGCTDPQVLFDKSSSGWDDNVMQSENPFGEGLFSTMMAADKITIKSVGFNAVFDVKRMFEENTTDVIEITTNRRQSGFTLILSDLRPYVSEWSVKRRFKETGRYIKSPTITVDGERVKYEGLSPNESSPFIHKFNTPLFKGWIVPDCYRDRNRNYMNNIEVRCFAFSRIIKASTEFFGVRGVVNFNENAVTLRSPDRKDFVKDEKYEACVDAFTEEIKKMFINLLKYGDDDTIRAYEDCISQYVDIADYRNHIRFKLLTPEKEQPLDDVKIGAEMITSNDASDDFDTDIADSDINDITSATVQSNTDFNVTTQITSSKPVAAQTSVATEPKKRTLKKRASLQTGDDIDTLTYGFYLDETEVATYENEVHIAQYYGVPIIMLRNSLERNIVSDDSRFNHISDIRDMIMLTADYRNTDPQTPQEHRAVKLLSRLAKAMNVDENMFIIADTKFQKVLRMSNGIEHTIEDIDVIATAYNDHVYINRKFMSAYTNLCDTSDTLTPADIKFLLINGQTLAHEMAHVIYKTVDNTQEHAEKTLQLLDSIIRVIYGQTITV